MADNRSRIIPSGLSVFGWCTVPDEKGIGQLHVDVGFGVGKFGGAPDDLIRFELKVRRAEIIVRSGQGVSPLASTIATPKSSFEGQTTTISESEKSTKGKLNVGFDPARSVIPDVSVSAGIDGHVAEAKKTEIITEVKRFLVQHGKKPEGNFFWEVSPEQGEYLLGNPWDSKSEPRFSFRFEGDAIASEPTVFVEVRCRGEDLDFGSGIEIKDEKQNRKLFSRRNRDVNLAAAEQYLKKVLLDEGLPISDPSEKYDQITIADVIVTVE